MFRIRNVCCKVVGELEQVQTEIHYSHLQAGNLRKERGAGHR